MMQWETNVALLKKAWFWFVLVSVGFLVILSLRDRERCSKPLDRDQAVEYAKDHLKYLSREIEVPYPVPEPKVEQADGTKAWRISFQYSDCTIEITTEQCEAPLDGGFSKGCKKMYQPPH